MTKWLLTLFFTFITTTVLFAQQTGLEIKGSGSVLYLTHPVESKENFYSIGRMYNVAPKDLAAYNKLQMESGLSVGQDLKIPLDKNNFTQSEVKSVLDFLIPVQHTVESGETLYRLGVNYNKVSLELIKKWNSLGSDAVNVGSPLIVGFLKVDKNQSSLAKNTPVITPEVTIAPVVEKKEPVVAPTPAPSKPALIEKAADTEINNTPQKTATPVTALNKNSGFEGGQFKAIFDQESLDKPLQTASGTGGTFKSTSGWQDGKYYCFNNNAMPGSIIKVTNNLTGKAIYAKVLDSIPDIKQNAGLLVIVSNAASDELGAGENKFECAVGYVN